MQKTICLKKLIYSIFFCICCMFLFIRQHAFAHEGHDHWSNSTIVIKKSTFKHLQSILESYRHLYEELIKKDIKNIPLLAQNIMDAAQRGVQTENKGEGRYMMEHIFLSAMSLEKRENMQGSIESFRSISNEVFPFFIAWPLQLKQNKLKLYYCKDDSGYWLQPQNVTPQCPYSVEKLSICTNIEEVANK